MSCAQEEDRVVCIRFGHDWDETCMQMDEVCLRSFPDWLHGVFCSVHRLCLIHFACFSRPVFLQILSGVADQVKNFAVVYCVDISEVPDFNTMYELYDPCTVMFFFRNKVSKLLPSYLLQQMAPCIFMETFVSCGLFPFDLCNSSLCQQHRYDCLKLLKALNSCLCSAAHHD